MAIGYLQNCKFSSLALEEMEMAGTLAMDKINCINLVIVGSRLTLLVASALANEMMMVVVVICDSSTMDLV
jgi:hypothetical protein